MQLAAQWRVQTMEHLDENASWELGMKWEMCWVASHTLFIPATLGKQWGHLVPRFFTR